jgi:hypothetical protein
VLRKSIYCLILIIALFHLPCQAANLCFGTFGGLVGGGGLGQEPGYILGAKYKVGLIEYFSLQPVISYSKFGSVEYDFGSREGSNLTHMGFELLIGPSMHPDCVMGIYGIIGTGYYFMRRDYDRARDLKGTTLGGGFEYRLSRRLGLDLEFRANFFRTGIDSGSITLGINYLVEFARHG